MPVRQLPEQIVNRIAQPDLKADLDAKIALIEAHVRAIEAEQKMRQSSQQHALNVADTVMGMAHDHQKHQQSLEIADRKSKEKPSVKN